MSERTGEANPALPRSIWVVAWASLADQIVTLIERFPGLDEPVGPVLSALLTALFVGYVSAGVVRARTIRLAIAWIFLGLALVGGALELVSVEGPADAAFTVTEIALTVVTMVALAQFHRSDWFAWQRSKPAKHEGASIGRLVAIAVMVGVLGGAAGASEGVSARLEISV